MTTLQERIQVLPSGPGVYLMRGGRDQVLYVGKAANLRQRVKSYFNKAETGDGRFHIAFLVPQIEEVEVQVTSSEREALILENTLIKKFQPRYNVQLKDDKTWLSLKVPIKKKWPRVTLTRRWSDDGSRYFGPYLDEFSSRKVLKLLTRTVPLRTCSDSTFRAHSERPCIEYQMGRCAGPCAGLIDEAGYTALVDEAVLLLEGRNKAVVARQQQRMQEASDSLRYEEAARLRDRIRILERLSQRQSAQLPGMKDRDVFGLHREGELAAVAILPIREGRMQDIRAFTFRQVLEEDGELLGRLIAQLYTETLPPPPVLLLPTALPDQELRAELLSEVAGRKVRLSSRSRGEGRRLLGLAAQNAQVRFAVAHSQQERSEQALFGLERALGLPSLPRRIECYDNSNIQGADPVGALVTFVDGRAHKAGYRIFKIKGVDGADDYATMTEVLSRRVKRATEGSVGWELPDLIVIDGGRGQLAQVEAVCRDLDVSVPLCSVAKPQEGEATDKIYIPGRKNPIKLKARDPALQLLQQLRDEAHRFGVHHHRKQRTGRTLTSGLDRIPGVGKQLRGRLLRHFGSLKRVRAAEVEELRAVRGVGEGLARVIREELRRG